MPSLLPTYTTREEHVKNQRADLMYRIITNKNKSPPKPKSSSKSSPKTPTKTPIKSPTKTFFIFKSFYIYLLVNCKYNYIFVFVYNSFLIFL